MFYGKKYGPMYYFLYLCHLYLTKHVKVNESIKVLVYCRYEKAHSLVAAMSLNFTMTKIAKIVCNLYINMIYITVKKVAEIPLI